MAKITASRYHDFSYGHRVCSHESKCACLHGHNGRVTFHCEAEQLDGVGRVVDFGVIKDTLCQWVETAWDHRFLVWDRDPLAAALRELDPTVVQVPFNPTAENMAEHLLRVVGEGKFRHSGVRLVRVTMEETRKCAAEAYL